MRGGGGGGSSLSYSQPKILTLSHILSWKNASRLHYFISRARSDSLNKTMAVTSLDGDNGDWGRQMPKKRKILEDKKEDLDL